MGVGLRLWAHREGLIGLAAAPTVAVSGYRRPAGGWQPLDSGGRSGVCQVHGDVHGGRDRSGQSEDRSLDVEEEFVGRSPSRREVQRGTNTLDGTDVLKTLTCGAARNGR